MRTTILLLALLGSVSTQALAADVHPVEQPLLHEITGRVSADELHSTIATLVGFGTRHTLSDTKSEKRGIGAARRWIKSRFESFSTACGGCLEVVTPSQTVTGTRVPQPTEVMDIVAIQRGTSDPDRVIVITGHLDSRVTDVMDFKHDAPGANDDGSGTAAVIEAARVLSKYKFPATLVYAALSGEEQGLYGGKVLADYAKQQRWQVETDLNNDIVGNTHGQDGGVNNTIVRIFSEGYKRALLLDVRSAARDGRSLPSAIKDDGNSFADSPSRNVARYMSALADAYLGHFAVRRVYRTDRYGRGGDQVPFLEAGYPAVRLTEADENYTRQHQDLRSEGGIPYGDTIDGVDFAYLAQVTRLNAITMASMAKAPAPPAGVDIEGAVKSDTTIKWKTASGAATYRVHWRDTTAPQWQRSYAAGDATTLTLKDVVIDDAFFGVSAVSADGFASPVAFPGDAGSFGGTTTATP